MIIISLFVLQSVGAQYLYDIGIGGGISGYTGEASRIPFSSPGYNTSIMFRSNINRRFALTFDGMVGKVNANTTNLDDTYPIAPGICDFDFETNYQSFNALFEVNFFPYPFENEIINSKNITPFTFIGLGIVNYNYDTPSTILPKDKDITMSLPVGAGVRMNFGDRWGFQARFKASKLFADNFDGYELNDPLELGVDNFFSNDWLYTTTIMLTYSFGKDIWDCNCPGGNRGINGN